jgi:pimeloyl-ACP methyl ester carboxylesterase
VMPASIYKCRAGEAEIQALYDEALDGLGLGYESLTVGTRAGDTHVLAVGPGDAPPVVFLPGGNFLNPTCLRWFSPLAADHRLYAPDLVGQPGRSSQTRPSPTGDGDAFWVEDVLDGLGLRRVPLLGISYGAGLAIRTMGLAPERVSRAALVSPAAVAAGPIPQAHQGAPAACGKTHIDRTRRPRSSATRGDLPVCQARHRPAPDGDRGRASRRQRTGGGVRLRG